MVNSCVIVFFVCFIVLNFVSIYALEKNNGKGLIYCFKVLALVNIAGGWGKYVALEYFDSFYVLIGG